MSGEWRGDPRVKEMDPEKIEFLEELSRQIERTPKSQIMNRFLTITAEAGRKGIAFSDQETDILAGVLAEYMNPRDRGRMELFRMLARRIGKR